MRLIFLKILSGNTLYTNALRDLENLVKVTQFELGLRLAQVLLCTKFVKDTRSIFSNIEQKPFLMAFVTSTFTRFIKFCEDTLKMYSDIEPKTTCTCCRVTTAVN